MTIQLTPDQERRFEAIVSKGAYTSVDEAVEAGLAVVEHQARSGFDGTEDELEALLLEGLDSGTMTSEEFWASVKAQTSAMRSEKRIVN